jgi:hypothetical protein
MLAQGIGMALVVKLHNFTLLRHLNLYFNKPG